MAFEGRENNDGKEQLLDLPQAVSKKLLIGYLRILFPECKKAYLEEQLSRNLGRYFTVVKIEGDVVTVFGAQNNEARPAPEFADCMFELVCSEQGLANIYQKKEEQKITEREELAKKIMETVSLIEGKEFLTFDALVGEIEKHLKIPVANILHCFNKVLRCRKEGLWTLLFDPRDEHVMINRYDDDGANKVEWELALSEGKIWDKGKQKMVEYRALIEVAGINSKYFRASFSRRGSSPKVDDTNPGYHIADED